MAIGPDDCVIYLDKVSTWENRLDVFGKLSTQRVYPPYWDKFIKNAIAKTPKNGVWEDYDATLKAELKNAGIVYKQTKKGSEYLKFRSNSDMLMFMLRWG